MMRNNLLNLLSFLLLLSLCPASAQTQNKPRLPELHNRRLLNDLQISVAPTPYLGEEMTIGLVIRYGSAFDPADKGGVANLLSRMFMYATADKSRKDIQDELSYLGATLEVKNDWDGCRFILRGQSSKFERSLLLLYQVVAEARFNEPDFNAVKESIIESIRKIPDPRQRIHTQFEDVLFGGTTYGRPIEGTYTSVSNINLGDVRLFYRKYFSPGQSSLVVVGNVPAQNVIARASRIWGVWVRTDDVPFSFLSPRSPAGRQIFLEDDPGSPAAQFIIGNLFPKREDPGYLNALIASHVFQERLTKALPTSLVTVGTEGRRMLSPFYVQGQAAAEQAVEQIQKIEAVASELKSELVTSEEVEAAQSAFIQEFNQNLKTTEGLCNTILDSELYHLGSNYASIFPVQVRRCDAEAIKQAANNWIFPGGQVLLVRGPAAQLKTSLESLGTYKELKPEARIQELK